MSERDVWLQRLATYVGVPFTTDNTVDVLRNGERFFPAMLDAVAAAQHRIDLVTFVWWRGPVVEQFTAALAERARAGVAVRVVVDEFGGSDADGACLRALRDAGVAVRRFRPRATWKFWQAGHRCHRRALVCDGAVAFTGGFGIAQEWQGDARGPSEWRDTVIRVRGPAVAALHGAFFDTWLEVSRSAGPLPAVEPGSGGGIPVQVVRGASEVHHNDVAHLFALLFRFARRRIRLSTAYFVPDEAFGTALAAAARRGVDVDVVVPGRHVDKRVGQLAGLEEYRPLLDAGVRIHHYEPSMMHAKVLTIDGVVAVVGSANHNARSMSLDQEVEAVMVDADTVSALDADLDHDISRSRRAQPPTGLRRLVADATDIVDDLV